MIKLIKILIKSIALIFFLWLFYVGAFGIIANDAPELFIALLLVVLILIQLNPPKQRN